MADKVIRMIELYSGIGGFHFAMKLFISSSISLSSHTLKVFPFDNNCNANKMYQHNFNIKPFQKNIEHLTVHDFNKINADIITLSPPCQPYTRSGIQKGSNDNRSNSLHHLCNNILPKINTLPKYILLENVIGFETSNSCKLFINTISKLNYIYNIYSINPTQINIPNTRKRIYILATLTNNTHTNISNNDPLTIITKLPLRFKYLNNKSIGDIISKSIVNNVDDNKDQINDDNNSQYLISMNKISKWRGYKFNIVTINDYDSECFTKAYGTKKNYFKGTGSLFASKLLNNNDILNFKLCYNELLANIGSIDNHNKLISLLSSVGLRFFTPKEMSLLMGFPKTLSFPNKLSNQQLYKLLGNSINVKVVSVLISILIDSF